MQPTRPTQRPGNSTQPSPAKVGSTRTFLPDKTGGTVAGYAFDGFPVKMPYETCHGKIDASGNCAHHATKRCPYSLGC